MRSIRLLFNIGLLSLAFPSNGLLAGTQPSTHAKLDDESARKAAEAWWLMMTGMSGINPDDAPVLRAMERKGITPAPMHERNISDGPPAHPMSMGGNPRQNQNPHRRIWTRNEYIQHYNRLGATPPPGGYQAYLGRQGVVVPGSQQRAPVMGLDHKDHMAEMAEHIMPGARVKRGRDLKAPEVDIRIKRRLGPSGLNRATRASGTDKVYHVVAINKDIYYTRFGDHDPNGMMYVLEEDKRRVLNCEGFNCGHDPLFFGSRSDDENLAPEPLVIRANQGDHVTIHFTNELAEMDASIHIHKGRYIADQSAGSKTGHNADSTVVPGETITYEWQIPDVETAQGIYYFYSHVDPRWQVPHGLHGALLVEPKGSVYLDTETGEPLSSGWGAIIDNPDPNIRAFREYAVMFEDRLDLIDARGNKPIDLYTGVQDAVGKGISYRSAPFFNNMNLFLDESMAYGSYTFGEFSTPVPRWYVSDPMRVRVIHAGSGEHHVFHNHAHRWRVNPKQEEDNLTETSKSNEHDLIFPKSTRIDSQTMGPGEVFDLEMEGGAGGVQRTVGDVLFHCHIIEHVVEGMWSTHRVFNTLQPDLAPLPDVEPLPAPVNSLRLLELARQGKPAIPVTGPWAGQPITQENLRQWILWQLPPRGIPEEELIMDEVHGNRTQNKADKWDWIFEEADQGPLAKGEPYDWFFGPGWPAEGEGPGAGPVGQRPDILFNPVDGRLAYPTLKPHLGRRPPFAPIRDNNPDTQGTAYLGLRLPKDSPFAPSGHKWGSGLVPEGAGMRHYDITAITLPIKYNDFGDYDPNGMIFTLSEDVADIRSGKKPAEPLVLRSNVGEGVQIRLRSALEDSEEVDGHSKVGMHIHLVQYDVQSSDGAVAGYNYETSVRPSIDAEGNPIMGRKALAPFVPVDDGPLDRSDEVVHTTWFSDVELGTVYWHDHSKLIISLPHGLFAALIVEPKDAQYKDRETGEEKYVLDERGFFSSTNGETGTQFADIHLPTSTIDRRTGQKRADFREFVMVFNDGTRLFTDNIAFSALEHGESRRDPESGFPSFNLRLEPFENRLRHNPDSSLVFSSFIHGDPATPQLQAYVGDPVTLRTETGGTNGVHVLSMHGHRWHFQRGAPETSPLRDFIVSGISEGFSHDLAPNAGGLAQAPGDYLYFDGDMDHRFEGMWGLFRVFDTLRDSLQPLPDRTPLPAGPGYYDFMRSRSLTRAGRPVRATNPGNPGPPEAPLKTFDVVAVETHIPYDSEGVGDSKGMLYVLAEDVEDVLSGAKATEPLVIRANKGDVIEINLTNRLSKSRVGLHASLVQYDVRDSDGSAVGWNPDQTAAPGQTVRYRWYADSELGTVYLYNPASLDETRHGLFGALIVEPEGSTFRDPVTGDPSPSGWRADIYPGDGGEPYREFVLFFHDGVDQIRYRVAVNYRVARREGANEVVPGGPGGNVRDPREDTVHDSNIWGDPATPLMRAYDGDRVVIRQLQPAYEDHHVFHLHGHSWHLERGDPSSNLLSNITDSVGTAYDIELEGGARVGDHLYHCHIMDHKKMGMWGLFRVHDTSQSDLKPLILPEIKGKTTQSGYNQSHSNVEGE